MKYHTLLDKVNRFSMITKYVFFLNGSASVVNKATKNIT